MNIINATLSEMAEPTLAPIVGEALINNIINDIIGTIILGNFLFDNNKAIPIIDAPIIIP